MLEQFIPDISHFIIALYVAEFILAFMIVFLERKNPAATVAWIMIIFIVPVGGIILYLLMSQNISRQKVFRLKDFEEVMISSALEVQIKEMKDDSYSFPKPEIRKWQPMITLNQTYSKSFYSKHNVLKIFTDGHEKMDHLLLDIQNAKRSINIMYFIVKNDEAGKRLIEALIAKALEGVEVRFLMDAMGSRQLFNAHMQAFKTAGGQYAFFFSPKFKFLNLKLNYRNHRKLVIIDDEIGYLGGFNIGNEYLGKSKKFGYWRDTHLRLTGGCVQDMHARFIMDWRVASGEPLVVPSAYYNKPSKEGTTGVQIVSSGPDSLKEEVKHGYLKMISAAKEKIYISSPYFIPSDSLMQALKVAVLSGVDVKIVFPEQYDHPPVGHASMTYIKELLDVGAEFYYYNKNAFYHNKALVVDTSVCTLGTANFDVRSLYYNYEVNAVIYDELTAARMEGLFYDDMAVSRLLTLDEYNAGSPFTHWKESFFRVFSLLF